MAALLPRRPSSASQGCTPVVLPEGGVPLAASPHLFAGHPLHRRAEVAVDGARITVRPVVPTDAFAVDLFVRGLSRITSYRRFHAPVARLSAEQLAGIVDVDHHERETLLATVRGPRREEIVAIAQWVAIGQATADMAIVVGDRWQRRGVGRVLAHHLGVAAAEAGIAEFDATVLADNPAPQRLAHGLSRSVDAARHGTTIDLRIPLSA